MVQKPGIVVERKVVQENDLVSAEWQLIVQDDGRSTLWFPFQVDKRTGTKQRLHWLPLPGSQHLFLESPIFETMFTGTRGPGKTQALIMDFAKEVGKGYGKSWRGILFRRTFGDLDDVVKKIQEAFPDDVFPGFKFKLSKSEYMAEWPTGEALLLRHMYDVSDYEEYHGHEYPWIGWEELTQWPDDKAYKKMFSCCRSAKPGIPTRVRATTNPFGSGHGWVKDRFQIPEMMGKVIRKPGEMPRVAINGTLGENFLLLHNQPHYATQIKQSASSEGELRAWVYGDWDVTSGGMFDDIWDREVHIIPPLHIRDIPSGWTIDRAYDHGQSHPFSVQWYLESNGEPIELPDGRRVGQVRGDVILWQEWYGFTGEPNKGLRMEATDIAIGIKERESDHEVEGMVRPGPADTEIYSKDNRGKGRSPGDDMEDEDVVWERADKSAGSRKRGWQNCRTFLRGALPGPDGTREKKGFFVCSNNRQFLRLVPATPRDDKDPDDVPGTYEDHACDSWRYRLAYEHQGMWRRGM